MPDMPGQTATGRDTTYSLNIEEAGTLYERAGHPRTIRTIQRYCASGHLDCVKEATTLGDKYFVNADSVARHIAQIEELIALENRTTSRDPPRLVASDGAMQSTGATQRQAPTANPPPSPLVATNTEPTQVIPSKPGPDSPKQPATETEPLSRPVATAEGNSSRHVERLEMDNERLRDDIDFLRNQVKTKDTQIASLLERDHETNFLIKGLQEMLTPLLSSPRPRAENNQAPLSHT